MKTAVELRGVGLRAGDRDILVDVNLSIAAGEPLVLIGRAGSGKTTTLKLINRLHGATSGQVLVEGRDVHDWDEIQLRRRIGYVIQETGLFPHFTVERNVAVVPRLLRWPDD